MLLNKLLEAPFPILVGLISQAQTITPDRGTTPTGSMDAPEYMMGAFAGIFLVAYILKITGYMPHKDGKDAHCIDFTDADRRAMNKMAQEVRKVTDLLAFRDGDGLERFPKMSSQTSRQGEVLDKLSRTQDAQATTLTTISSQLDAITRAASRGG